MRTMLLDFALIVLPDLLCEKSHLVAEPSSRRYDRNARGVEVIRQASILVGKLPKQHNFIGQGSLDLGYAPNPSIENDVFQAAGDFGMRDDLHQTQRHFERVAQVVFFTEDFQLGGKIRIRGGCRIKHGESPCVGKSAVLYNFSSSRCGSVTAVVRAGLVVTHLVGSFRLLNKEQLRGFRFLLRYLLLCWRSFIVRFWGFSQIELNRAKQFAIQRTAIICRALLHSFKEPFRLWRETYTRCKHVSSLSAFCYHVNPQISGAI